MEFHPIVSDDSADAAECVFQIGQSRGAKSQKVCVSRWSMGYVKPQIKKQSALKQELVGKIRDANAVEHPFQTVSRQYKVKILIGFSSMIE
jgi:hypothetical protein